MGRRLFHLFGTSLFPLLSLFISREVLLWAVMGTTAGFLLFEGARLVLPGVNRWFFSSFGALLRGEEVGRPTGASYVLISTLIVFLIFDKGIAAISLLFLAIGDPMAGLVGGTLGRIRFFGKSLGGSMAAFLACLGIGFPIANALGIHLPVVLAGALSASVVEFLPLPVNDNLTMPILSVTAMFLVGLLF